MGVNIIRFNKKINEPSLIYGIEETINEIRFLGFFKKYAIDISSYIKYKGIIVDYSLNLPISCRGCLKYKNNKWVISINKKHSIYNQRFTLAYEYAHYFLHSDKNSNNPKFYDNLNYYDNHPTNQYHFTANKFAEYILIPEDAFQYTIKDNINKIYDLCHKFRVLPIIIESRVKDLGYIKKNIQKK
jgi:Zn-dependent peptidase ImmA (M78 family)